MPTRSRTLGSDPAEALAMLVYESVLAKRIADGERTCDKCGEALASFVFRLDINAAGADARHAELCRTHAAELIDWLEVPFQPLVESPDANPDPEPRRKHQ